MALSSSPALAVKVLHQFSVSPPRGSVPDTSIPLSFIDLMWMSNGPVERLFFYSFPYSTSHFIDNFLPRVKSSLSLVLQHFFLLSGHLRYIPDSDRKFDYFYQDGDSVPLTLAECNGDFAEISGDQPRHVPKLLSLVPGIKTSEDLMPLMALQVTVFPNHGLCVGVAIHHGACDGASSMNFVKSWAATCFAEAAITPVLNAYPLYDRSLLRYPSNLDSLYLDFVMKFRGMMAKMESKAAPEDEIVLATFKLGREQIQKLKQWILAGYNGDGKSSFHCSTFVVACAYIWTCLVRTRQWPEDRLAYIGFAVDARDRMKPPVPRGYVGNCLGVCKAAAKTGDLVKEDGVRTAAEAIGKSIEELRDGVLKDAEEWPEFAKCLADLQPLTIAGSPRFGVYETDFGWGKPAKVEVTSIRKNESMSLAEMGDGLGGIQLGFALANHDIDELSSYFAAGLENL